MFGPLIHYTLALLSAVVTLAVGIIILMMRVPYAQEWNKFRWVRGFFAATCMVLSAANIASVLLQREADEPRLLAAATLIVASCQALLFTSACLVFVHPLYVTRRNVILQLGTIGFFGVALLLILHFVPVFFPYAYTICATAYAGQLVTYTHIFRKGYNLCVTRLEAYYDEEERGRLRWVRHCFYSALAVGIVALLFSYTPVSIILYDWFVVAFTFYYIYMAGCVINYRIDAHFIVQVMTKPVEQTEEENDEEVPAVENGANDPTEAYKRMRRRLDAWIAGKRYLLADTSPNEVARELGVSRHFLSSYFSVYEKMSFRSWRTQLRIREAERILREEENVSLVSLNMLVGISDRSNFYKQFRLVTGMRPLDYREKYRGIKLEESFASVSDIALRPEKEA